MNPIKNIEIKNFKSIRHLKIDGCRQVNVFVGYPNVGKSNILEAISLLGVNELAHLKDLIRVKEVPTIFFNGFIEDDLMVSFNDEFAVFGGFSNNTFSLQFQPKVGEGDIKKVRINAVLNKERIRLFEYKNFETLPIRSGHGEIPDQFLVKKYEYSKKTNFRTGGYTSLDYPFGENIFSILQTNKALLKSVAELFEIYNLEFLYDNREQGFTILKRTDSGIFTVPYELLADTLQRLIFYKAAIGSNKEKILLFEEPEAHMFPPYVRKFTADVVFDKSNQYFIATQSPYVLDSFMEEVADDLAIYLVYYENGETKIKLMSENDIDEVRSYGVDVFYNLESYLKHGQVNNA